MIPAPAAAGSLGRILAAGDRRFWYDTARNALCEVDPVLAAVLPVFGRDNEPEVLERLAADHDPTDLRRAMDEIRRARREEGLFRLEGPPVAMPAAAVPDDAAITDAGQLTLCLSERCNLRCRYCTQAAAGPRGDAVMSRATALAALRWFAARCADTPRPQVSFYGGEPLLHLDLVEAVVAEARRHPQWPDLTFTLDTNATLIDERAARFLAAERLHLQVSLDGPPEVHDRHRRRGDGAPTHAAVTAGLRRLLEVDPTAAERLRFAATVTPPYDFLGLAAWFADFPLYRELGLDARPHVRLNTANLEGTPLEPRSDQWRTGLAAARARYAELHRDGRRDDLPAALAGMLDGALVKWHHRNRKPQGDSQFPAGACRPGVRRLFVAPDGSFLPCERAGAEWRIGHVDTGLDAGAIAALHRALLEVLAGACPGCWAQRLCRVCFTAVRPGLPRAEARARAARTCAGVRRQAAADLELYLQLWQENPASLGFLARTGMA